MSGVVYPIVDVFGSYICVRKVQILDESLIIGLGFLLEFRHNSEFVRHEHSILGF